MLNVVCNVGVVIESLACTTQVTSLQWYMVGFSEYTSVIHGRLLSDYTQIPLKVEH